MKIFISESDRQNAREIALKNIARFYGIRNWESETNDALYKKISLLKTPLLPLLDSYFKAYDNWFDFYKERKAIEEKEGMEYILKFEEYTKLSDLIQKRENALNNLQKAFDELQIKKFNIETFGKDIPGIIYEEPSSEVPPPPFEILQSTSGILQANIESLEIIRENEAESPKRKDGSEIEKTAKCIRLKQGIEQNRRGIAALEREMRKLGCP